MSSASQTISVPHLGNSAISYAFAQPYDQARPTWRRSTRSPPRLSSTEPSSPMPNSARSPISSQSSPMVMAGPTRHTGTSPTGTAPSPTCRCYRPLGSMRRSSSTLTGRLDRRPHGHAGPGCGQGGSSPSAPPWTTRASGAGPWAAGTGWSSAPRRSTLSPSRSATTGSFPPNSSTEFWESGPAPPSPPRCASSGTPSTSGTTPATKAATGCVSPRSTCATATACTRDWHSIYCPVLWLHGTADQVYSIPNAEEEITMFTNSAGAELRIVERGQVLPERLDPDTVNAAAIELSTPPLEVVASLAIARMPSPQKSPPASSSVAAPGLRGLARSDAQHPPHGRGAGPQAPELPRQVAGPRWRGGWERAHGHRVMAARFPRVETRWRVCALLRNDALQRGPDR